MSIKELITRLSKQEVLQIPYSAVARSYSGQMAEVMDHLSKSKASQEVKATPASNVRWGLVCERSPDPENVTDQEAFRAYLVSNSKVYLKATVGNFIWYEPLHSTPSHFMAQFEQRAKWITDHRKALSQREAATTQTVIHEEPQEPLLAALNEWCSEHRNHDPRLAQIALCVLEQLIQSAA